MNKPRWWLFLFWIALTVLAGNGARAETVTSGVLGDDGRGLITNGCPEPSGGGGSGELPIPFDISNRHVELADGELYLLEGQIKVWGNYAFLEIDLKAHPWLATEKRRNSPYYQLSWTNGVNWEKYKNLRVQVFATARGVVVKYQQRYQYVVSLDSFSDPTPVVIPSRRR